VRIAREGWPFIAIAWLPMRIAFLIACEPWDQQASRTIDALADLRTTLAGLPTVRSIEPTLGMAFVSRAAVLAAIGEAMSAAEAEA